MSTTNSYFDDLKDLSVEDILTSSELIEGAVNELLEGEQAYELIFDPFNTGGKLTVGYNLDSAPGLDEEAQTIAEFAEIPVGDPSRGERRYTDLLPAGIGVRVSYAQRNFTSGAAVQRELLGRAAEIRRKNGRDALAAFAAVDDQVEELPVAAKWNTADAKAMDDLYAADDLLAGAVDHAGRRFGYAGRYVWANRRTINALKRNKQVTDLYVGDMAHADPRFTPIGRQPVIGEQFELVVDDGMEDGVAYVMSETPTGGLGTRFEAEPPRFSDWYEEGGQSGLGGPRLTWRSDYVHFRSLEVRAPKALVKITGAI